MKKVKRAVVLFVVCLTIISFIESSVVQIAAHTTRLNVSYDICDPSSAGGGINKMWYVLEKNSESYHLGDDAQTIRYYFEQNGEDGYTWTTTVGAPSEEIKTAYANSMKKWNNVYFYCYNSDGTITKRKLINIVEGTENNYDLSIVPAILDSVATTAYVNGNGIIGEGATANSHYSNWIMWVDVTSFYKTVCAMKI